MYVRWQTSKRDAILFCYNSSLGRMINLSLPQFSHFVWVQETLLNFDSTMWAHVHALTRFYVAVIPANGRIICETPGTMFVLIRISAEISLYASHQHASFPPEQRGKKTSSKLDMDSFSKESIYFLEEYAVICGFLLNFFFPKYSEHFYITKLHARNAGKLCGSEQCRTDGSSREWTVRPPKWP